jgi:hypothetical protein
MVLLPFIQEGPYTRKELHECLLNGKARSDDRIRDTSGHLLTIKDLIPEAEDIFLNRLPTSDRIRRTSKERQRPPATSVAPPSVIKPTKPLPTATTSPVHGHSERLDFLRRLRLNGKLVMLFLATALAFTWLHWPGSQEPLPPLFSPPAITELTQAELNKLPQDQLLARLFDECTRRMFSAHRGWRSGPDILPSQAYPLWIIGYLEPILLYSGLEVALTTEHMRGTPSTPSLAQLADAYTTIGNPAAAQVLREALELYAQVDSKSDSSHDPYAALKTRLRTALGGGTTSLRLRYALAHRATLLRQ